jgi:Uma2 family endonuclease
MNARPKHRMTADEFLVWGESVDGRHELFQGEVVAMAPEPVRHAKVKFAVARELSAALDRVRLECEVLPDGVGVRIDDGTVFEPDAQLYCGPRLEGDALEVPHPLIVVEVLSPSTGRFDSGTKLIAYFRVPSVVHYLIIDPLTRVLVHHRRDGETILTRVVPSGMLRLDPPGLDLDLDAVFADL